MTQFAAVECFWVDPNGMAARTLRRYSGHDVGGRCPYMSGDYSYHRATAEIGEFPATYTDHQYEDETFTTRFVALVPVSEYEGDERWPTHCECGYVFTDDDRWQANQEPIYEAADGRHAWTSPAHCRQPTPGAMFDTFWRPACRKADGLAISVVCPDGGVWCVDDQASSGGYWERTGKPPKITVTPSIQTSDYHGFLRDGILTASI
jgi:hypothetical protein